MRYAVTGGAGFIGSHLTKYLISEGHDVTVVDNLSRGRLSNIGEIRNKVRLVNHSITDYTKLDLALRDMDGIFHQAALSSVPESYNAKEDYMKVNVAGSKNVFSIALKHDIKVVYASSASVYGNTQTIPIAEGTKRLPLNPYGQTKLEAEYVAESHIDLGAQIIGLRYFNVFGVGQTLQYAGVITRFVDRVSHGLRPIIYGSGLQTRDFTYVLDVVKANLVAMNSKTTSGFFNIGGGEPVSIMRLADMIIQISGCRLEPEYYAPRPGDALHSMADISAAAKYLDWKPQTALEDGLQIIMSGGDP